jgi:hypothetical protein
MLVLAVAVAGLTAAFSAPALGQGWGVAPSANPLPQGDDVLAAVARVPDTHRFFAVGWTTPAETELPADLIETSSGVAWTAVPGPTFPPSVIFAQLFGVAALSPSNAWAVGVASTRSQPLPQVAHWNGRRWSATTVPLPPGGQLGSLASVRAFSSTDAVAVGVYQTSTRLFGLVERWNGHRWIATQTPNPPGCGVTLSSLARVPISRDLVVVGSCLNTSDPSRRRPVIERFHHGVWSVQPSPRVGLGALAAVTPVSATGIWAVGYRLVSGLERTLTERWNGRRWSVVPSPNDSATHSNVLEGVIRVPGSRTVWAVGLGGGGAISLVWRGAAWKLDTPVQPPRLSVFSGVAASPTQVWAVGTVITPSGADLTLAEHHAG